MIPQKTIEELINKHSALEKDLSSGKVDKKGKVRQNSIKMIRGNPVFEEAAVTAVSKSQWKPAMQRDMKVGVWMTVPVNFKLKDAQ